MNSNPLQNKNREKEMQSSNRPRRQRPLARVLLRLAQVAWVLSATAAFAQTSPYPDPLPDFGHFDDPHTTLYSWGGGNDPRPMLVIYVRFPDNCPNDDCASSGQMEPSGLRSASNLQQWVTDRFFGGFPSVADYFWDQSQLDLELVPAEETEGFVNDGVVVVNAGSARSFIGLRPEERLATAAALADRYVDFSRFDQPHWEGPRTYTEDGYAGDTFVEADGVVNNHELIIHVVREPVDLDPTDMTIRDICGVSRSLDDPDETGDQDPQLDGVTLDLLAAETTPPAGFGTDNFITQIHETAHTLFDGTQTDSDAYGFGVGGLDVFGPTCGASDTTYFGMMSLHKLHLGWVTPHVVTEDGYYQVVNDDGHSEAYILYDPRRSGTASDHYLLVEARKSLTGTYDQNVSDSGLVVWLIDDSVLLKSTLETVRPMEIVRPDGVRPGGCWDFDLDGIRDEIPANGIDDDGDGLVDTPRCYGGSSSDAWDPSDSNTPQRTLEAGSWRDDVARNVAIRAIDEPLDGASGMGVRAYFDVPGPGALVDAYDLRQAERSVFQPGETEEFTVTVRNTGDPGGPFDPTWVVVDLVDPPQGWSSEAAVIELAAQTDAEATIRVTAGPDAPSGSYWLEAEARYAIDSSVRSNDEFEVVVVGVAKSEDRLEPNDTLEEATPLELVRSQSLDLHILDFPFSSVGSSQEVWSVDVPGLNLHDDYDRDVFRPKLPTPEFMSALPEGIPECSCVVVDPELGLGVRFTTVLKATILDPPQNIAEEAIDFVHSEDERGTYLDTWVECPRLLEGTEFVLDRLDPGHLRRDFPDYDLRVEYLVSAEQGQCGPGKVSGTTPLPCLSGFFPDCEADPDLGDLVKIDLGHPSVPSGSCALDGCPDLYSFYWDGAGDLDLRILSSADLGVRLLDEFDNPLGQAVAPLEPTVSEGSEKLLHVADLPAGPYRLEIAGLESALAIEFAAPAPAPDADGDGQVGPRRPACGLGFEGALLLPGLFWLRRRRSRRQGIGPRWAMRPLTLLPLLVLALAWGSTPAAALEPQLVVDVTDYGALPDDGSPDTLAFAAALTELREANGGILAIPPGTFEIDGSLGMTKRMLDVPSGVWVRGAGKGATRLVRAGGFPRRVFQLIGAKNVRFSDLALDLRADRNFVTGIHSFDGSGVTVDHCRIETSLEPDQGWTIMAVSTAMTSGVRVSDCDFYQTQVKVAGAGGGGPAVWVERNRFVKPHNYAVSFVMAAGEGLLNVASGAIIAHNQIEGRGSSGGIYVGYDSNQHVAGECSDISITDNQLRGSFISFAILARACVVSRNWIIARNIIEPSERVRVGIKVSGIPGTSLDGLLVSGNHVRTTDHGGIKIQGGPITGARIVDNHLVDTRGIELESRGLEAQVIGNSVAGGGYALLLSADLGPLQVLATGNVLDSLTGVWINGTPQGILASNLIFGPIRGDASALLR